MQKKIYIFLISEQKQVPRFLTILFFFGKNDPSPHFTFLQPPYSAKEKVSLITKNQTEFHMFQFRVPVPTAFS
jgi:hypothetical protein